MLKWVGVIIASAIVLLIGVQFISSASNSLQSSNINYFTNIPSSVTASSVGPPDQVLGTSTNSVYLQRDYVNAQSVCERVASSQSSLVNPLTGTVKVALAKANNPLNNVTVTARNSSGLVVKTFGTLNATTLTTNLANYTFNGSSGYTPSLNDRICVDYTPENPTPATITTIYNQTLTGTQIHIANGGSTRLAEQVVDTSSILYNKQVNYLDVDLAKTGSPAGTVTAGVWNNAGSLVYTIGSLDISTLTTTETNYSFFNANANYTMQTNDRIGVEYTGGNSSTTRLEVYIHVFSNSTSSYDSTHSQRSRWQSGWFGDNVSDLTGHVKLYAIGTKSRYAVNFDGSANSYVALNYNQSTNPLIPDNATIWSGAAFVYPIKIPSSGTMKIISDIKSSTTSGFDWAITTSGTQQVQFYNKLTSTTVTYEMKNYIEPGRWHMLAFSYNGTQKALTFWADNNPSQVRQDSATRTMKAGTDKFDIGWRPAGATTETFQGKMDRVRFWNTTLNDSLASQFYNGVDILQNNKKLAMDFDIGTGTITGDSSINHIPATLQSGVTWTPFTNPNWVIVGIDRAELPLYDLTNTFNDSFSGDKQVWMIGWNNHPEIFTTSLLDNYKARGIDTILIQGVNVNWDSSISPYSTAAGWIAEAKAAPYNMRTQAVVALAASTVAADVQYCNSTAYTQTQILNTFDTIVSKTSSLFDAYSIDVECSSLSDYSTNKNAELNYYVGNLTKWLRDDAHSKGKTFGDWTDQAIHTTLKTIANPFPHGINDINSDFTLVGDYLYTNVTVTNAFQSILNDDSVNHRLYETVNLRQPGANLPQMDTDQLQLSLQTVSNMNQTQPNVLGISLYFYGFESPSTPLLTQVLDKTPIIQNKLSYGNTYNGTTYRNDLTGFDLAATINTSKVNVASNAIDGNLNTSWQNAIQKSTSDYIIGQLASSKTISKVRIYSPDLLSIPSTVNVYTSNDGLSWSLMLSNYPLSQAVGYQTIDLPGVNAQYVKIQPTSYSATAQSFKVAEMDIQYYIVTMTDGGSAIDAVAANYSVVIVVILLIPLMLIFPRYFTME